MASEESTSDGEQILYAEPGARWRAVWYGPILCVVVMVVEAVTGQRVHWPALVICALVMVGLVSMIVSSARTHVRVELTPTHLCNGTDSIALSEVTQVFPERDDDSWDDEPWEAARVLGELPNVPRGRTAIGLELDDGILVRTWAKDDERLRAGLDAALAHRDGAEGDGA